MINSHFRPINGLAHLFALGIMAWVVGSCGSSSSPASKEASTGQGVEFAKGFSITSRAGNRVIEVRNPWQGASNIRLSYLLYDRQKDRPLVSVDSLFECIPVPIKKVVVLSTTHIAFLDKLEELQTIVAVSGTRYVYHPLLRAQISAGKVREAGYDQALDYEMIYRLQPDVVLAFGVGNEVSGHVRKLRDLNIPVFLMGEYLEEDPLGRAEWLKAVGCLLGKTELANRLFEEIRDEYLQLKSKTINHTPGPKVLVGLPWKNTWFVAGGKSYAARLIADAGAEYLWADSPSRETIPLDLEGVFAKAAQADFWINTGSAQSLPEILGVDARLADFPPLMAGKVYNNNARLSPGGGLDYWESGCVHPHWILADLIRIFHPELLPNHSFRYYQQLK